MPTRKRATRKRAKAKMPSRTGVWMWSKPFRRRNRAGSSASARGSAWSTMSLRRAPTEKRREGGGKRPGLPRGQDDASCRAGARAIRPRADIRRRVFGRGFDSRRLAIAKDSNHSPNRGDGPFQPGPAARTSRRRGNMVGQPMFGFTGPKRIRYAGGLRTVGHLLSTSCNVATQSRAQPADDAAQSIDDTLVT